SQTTYTIPVNPIPSTDGLQKEVNKSRQALDAWVREIVQWHFDPATGCPFWVDRAAKLGWDPRKEIRGYDDLDRFGNFNDEWLRLAVEHLAQHRGGICFQLDLDPRWFIKTLKMGHPEWAEDYKRHVVDQALTLLRAHPNIQCLFTTPKLLEALCDKVSPAKIG